MTEKGLIEYLTKSLRDAAARIQNGDLTGGMTDASNAVSVAVAAMVVHTDNMIGAQLYIDMVREAIRDNVDILYKVHNKDPKAAWDGLSAIASFNCDRQIGS
ncbi:MAG: hypothetical protein PHT96_03780 [Syntrophorhabdaceae bacterium]|nr:hypothetical protein [Syntrophorhabdaceae bacterium]